MRTTVVLTQGHISIRRGRVTRQYLTLTKASFRRLTRTCGDGPTDYLTTNRSVIYIWHGLSTLTADQRKLYDLYHDMSVDSLPGPRPVSPSGIEWKIGRASCRKRV